MGKRQRSSSPSTVDETHDSDNSTNNNNNNSDDVKNCEDVRELSSSDSDAQSVSTQSFSAFLWSEVSVALYTCLLKLLHYTCGLISIEQSRERRREIVSALQPQLMALWEKETAAMDPSLRERLADIFHQHVNAMFEQLMLLSDGEMKRGERCRAFLHMLNVFGFPEKENSEEAVLHANTGKRANLNSYSYNARTSDKLSVLPRYEGDRRTEEQHTLPRVGRVVHFPCPHPHQEINTQIQLIEPKKRRPQLDENQIFSRPKKATSSAMEDILLDEELQYRALVVLARHLDTFGSVQHISPFVRFVLWNALERDEEMFELVSRTPANSEEASRQLQALESLRKSVAERRAAFDATRVEAREAAVRIGWSAVSAHWRDQVLRIVEESDDADWYLLRDSARSGAKAIFPNYAGSAVVKEIALKALRRVRDGHVDCAVEDTSACYEVISNVLFPLLEGFAPTLSVETDELDDASSTTGDEEKQETNKDEKEKEKEEEEEQLRKRVASLMGLDGGPSLNYADVARGVRYGVDCGPLLTREGSTCSFITGIFVWPLQCLASFLELIAVGRYSVEGLKKFAAAFIQTNWGDEELLLEFLLRREPTNMPLASFVGFPRLARDVFISAQWLRNDKHFSHVVECCRQSFLLSPGAKANNYIQWRALSIILSESGNSEDILALTVTKIPPHFAGEGKFWNVAELECTPKKWIEGLALMMTTTVNMPSATCGTN